MRRLFILLLLASVLTAADGNGGGYAGAFSRYATDARSAALAGATVADINSGNLTFANPASLVFVTKLDLGLSYMSLPLDRSIQSGTLAFRLPPTAAAAVSFVGAGDDNIVGRNSIGQETEIFTYYEYLLSLSFANKIGKYLSMGFNANLLNIALAGESSSGFSLDFGMLLYHPRGYAVGFNASNISGSYAWRIGNSDDERSYTEYLPKIISIGARLPLLHFAFLGQFDIFMPDEGEISYIPRLAVEDVLNDRYFLRLGAQGREYSLGGGLAFTMKEVSDSRVDYSLTLNNRREGFGHLFTWVFKF